MVALVSMQWSTLPLSFPKAIDGPLSESSFPFHQVDFCVYIGIARLHAEQS